MSIRLLLTCGCCGDAFHTWPGYVDQDQDAGYGICAECQHLAGERADAEMEAAFCLIRDGLRPQVPHGRLK